MENINSRWLKASSLHVLVVTVALLALLLSSCRHDKPCHHEDDARYAQLDSLLLAINDPDSLGSFASQSHNQNDPLGEMLALRHQGNKLHKQSRFAEAIDAHERGLKVAKSLADTIEQAMSLNCLGEDYRRMGSLSEANGHYFEVLKLCDGFSDQECDGIVKAMAMAFNSLGNIEMELNNYALADSAFHEALRREQQLDNNPGIARNYSALGRVKCDLGDVDSAWYYQRKALEYNQLGGVDFGVAMCHLHFGELHESENRFSHAVEEYKIAYDMLDKNGETWSKLMAGLALARVHILLGESETAHTYLKEAEIESERIGSKEIQAEAHLAHYEYSLLQGNSQEALMHYVRGTELMDSINGRQKSEEMRAQRIAYQNGRMNGELDVLNRDITQLKRRSSMRLTFGLLLFLMACGIIASLVYAMRVRNRTQRLMSQVEETRSLFFTNVVHMIRTPLSAIMGAIDGIVAGSKTGAAQGTGDNVQQQNYEIIERQGNNLLNLVDRILEVGSVRSAITELDWRTCDAVTYIHMILESYRDRCAERHIELTYAPSENNVDVVVVPRYLHTIVTSLIDNAVNYCSDFGKIMVTTHVEGGLFVIRVADDGMGISKADLPHVFEPFYRSSAAEALIEGVGIGLTVVRDMTMAMDGVVAADSQQGQGSVFTVKLPMKHGHGVKERFDETVEPLVDKLRPQRRRQEDELSHQISREGLPVVLVVEDHVDVARLVGMVLGENYNVHYATDGEQGIAKADELVPDLIITDVKMPLLDGLDMCRYLRQNSQLCHIPVIMLSARNSDSDRVRGIEAGADAYMVKPFVAEELRAWVSRLLENRRLLRDVYAAPEQVEPSVEPLPCQQEDKDVEDTARFLADFAREVDRQFAACTRIDIDKVARSYKMGESQLRRKIQALTGKSVPSYISQLRMEKAMHLLKNSSPDTLISTIAEQCGFQDVAYFSRVFRQHYGMTPTQARNGNGGN